METVTNNYHNQSDVILGLDLERHCGWLDYANSIVLAWIQKGCGSFRAPILHILLGTVAL